MHIDIPDDLHRRLEQLAKGIGQDVGTLVCEAIEERLALEERENRPQESLARMGRNRAWNFLQAILTGRTNVIRAEEADERRARAIIEHYQDKEFSYCDAVSFAVMERLDIREAIAFDDHFRQYGQFTIL